MDVKAVPGWEGSIGPFPGQYGQPHVYARDVQSGAGNCVCGQHPGSSRHVQIAPGVAVPPAGMVPLFTDDTIKALRETLAVAQTCVGLSGDSQAAWHVARLQRLISDCDRQRPLASDGKHSGKGLCTLTCGCED